MVFPKDVNKVVTEGNKIVGENKVQAVLVGLAFGTFLVFIVVNYFFSTYFGLGVMAAVGVVAVLLCIVAVLLFRFMIFDEYEKKKEFEGENSDSFAKYMWLRAGIDKDIVLQDQSVKTFEFVNGSAMWVLELRFGSNDDARAAVTRTVNEKLIEIACNNGLEIRMIDMAEDFRNSREFKKHVQAINSIGDKKAAKVLMVINDAIMEESYRLCNVDVLYVMMRTTGNYQRADLEVALGKVLSLLRGSVTAYRSIHFLNEVELMEFFRMFYKISAIDLSMMKTVELSKTVNDEYDNIVSLLRLQAASGRVFDSEMEIFDTMDVRINQ